MYVCTSTWRSLRTADYQPGTAQCLSECFTFTKACVYLLSAFKSVLSKYLLALPGALLFVLVAFFIQKNHQSVSETRKLLCRIQKTPHHSWWQESAMGIVVCTQAFISVRSTPV